MTSVQPPAPVTPAGPVAAPLPPGETASVEANVTGLPPSLENTDRTLNLKGEVQQINSDGSVRIATPRGPIDVRLPDGQTVTPGQRVDISIPAGSPPASVQLTVAQPPAAPGTGTPPAPQTPPLPAPSVPGPPAPTTPAPGTPPPGSPGTPPSNPPVTGTPFPIPGPGQAPAGPVVTTQLQANLPPIPNAALPGVQGNQPIADLQGQKLPPVQNAGAGASAYNPGAAAPGDAPDLLSPRGLTEFLKNSLQAFLKAPQLNADNAANMQRPLQMGQMVRLLPLTLAQAMSSPAASTQPGNAAQSPALASSLPANINSLTPGNGVQIKNIGLAFPGAIATGQPGLLQNIMATVLGPAASIGAQPAVPDALAKLLLPFLNTAAAPAIPGTAFSGGPVLAQTMPGMTGPLNITGTPQLHQPVIAVMANDHPTPQTMLDVKVSGFYPMTIGAAAQSPGIATLLHGTPLSPVLFVQVTGQTAQGLPVVELPPFSGNDVLPKVAPPALVLQFPARGLSPATILKLDVLQTAMPITATAMPQRADAMAWDALDDILRANPGQPLSQAAAQAVQLALPKPGSIAFSAPVLMLAAAIRGGDIAAWMGDKAVEALRSARRADILGKIGADFAAGAKRMSDEALPTGEWKSLTLPMLYGPEISRIQLHYRSFERDGDTGQEDGRNKGTRFVMDLALTRMGPMQIDGFSIGRKLDITLRSEQSFSAAARQTIRERYHNAVEGIGFSGELNFNAAPDHKGWVVIDESHAVLQRET